ncbi:MAG: hypothetical protein NZO16_03495 [Deltaproteobacteria bacterium]|nr:hypothetical protein [Deltaproteobacteria bacterium]
MSEEKKVEKVSKIKRAEAINPIDRVSRVEKTQRVRQPTLALSPEKRAELFKLIEEEAKKLSENGLIPETDRDVITKAVEYALESSLISAEEEES